MANLILALRSMCAVGATDYTIGGVAHWTDDQLQAVLDETGSDVTRLPLTPEYKNVGGEAQYLNYYIPREYRHLEDEGDGSPWQIEDGNGDVIATAGYNVNLAAGRVSFTADTEGAGRYLTTTRFDLNAAAAEVWERKAAYWADAYDFAADGARYDRSQMHTQALAAAAKYRAKGGLKVGRMVRDDAN